MAKKLYGHGYFEIMSMAQFRFEKDDRGNPDRHRRCRFAVGWRDASIRGRTYGEQPLRRLTWQNLGYRMGSAFGEESAQGIDEAFDFFSEIMSMAQFKVEKDDRGNPDRRRRCRFAVGWRDASIRGRTYGEQPLKRLTWQNLGYRMGSAFGEESAEGINEAFDFFAAQYRK